MVCRPDPAQCLCLYSLQDKNGIYRGRFAIDLVMGITNLEPQLSKMLFQRKRTTFFSLLGRFLKSTQLLYFEFCQLKKDVKFCFLSCYMY